MKVSKVASKIGFYLLIIFAISVSCEKDTEQHDASSFQTNKLERALMKSIENDSVFKKNEIQWQQLSSYKIKEGGYFITVPVISEKEGIKGKVMFEIIDKNISKKYLRYPLNTSGLESLNEQVDFTTHDVLEALGEKQYSKLKSSSFPEQCMLCHGGVIIGEVDVYGDDPSDDWDDYDYSRGGDDIVLPGGGIGGSGSSPAPDPVPAPDIPIIDIEEYLECLNLNAKAKLTIYVNQPIANSDRVVSNSGDVGHTYINITQGNNRSSFGFYPENSGKPGTTDNGAYGDDAGADFDVSISIEISSSQLNAIMNYITNNNNGYDLYDYNCTDFALDIAELGGLNLPDTYSSYGTKGGSNPGCLGQDIRNMNLPNGASRNITGGTSPYNRNDCNN